MTPDEELAKPADMVRWLRQSFPITMRERELIANAIERLTRKVADENARHAIDGAMGKGYQNADRPPRGHWLAEYWRIGRERAIVQEWLDKNVCYVSDVSFPPNALRAAIDKAMGAE